MIVRIPVTKKLFSVFCHVFYTSNTKSMVTGRPMGSCRWCNLWLVFAQHDVEPTLTASFQRSAHLSEIPKNTVVISCKFAMFSFVWHCFSAQCVHHEHLIINCDSASLIFTVHTFNSFACFKVASALDGHRLFREGTCSFRSEFVSSGLNFSFERLADEKS